jgi:hypothetical protein
MIESAFQIKNHFFANQPSDNILLHFQQIVNRNISHSYDINVIVDSLSGSNYEAKSEISKFIIGRFFKEGSRDDLVVLVEQTGITLETLRALYLSSPHSKSYYHCEWDSILSANNTYSSPIFLPSKNKAVEFLEQRRSIAL